MRYSKTLIKQSEYGINAHIYEHIVACAVARKLSLDGLFQPITYRLEADTYDGIVVLSIEADTSKLLQKIIKEVYDCQVTTQMVHAAIEQVSSEYERLYKVDIEQLKSDIEALHKTKWLDRQNSLLFTQPITDTARSLQSTAIDYYRINPRSFSEAEIIYKFVDCPFQLKPLVVYVIQALSLAQIDMMYTKIINCYDRGDEWAEYQDLVGYAHYLRFPKKSSIHPDKLRAIFDENYKYILENDFVAQLIKYIDSQSKLDFAYFSTSAMFTYAYSLIGEKGWQKVNTRKNIEYVLENLEIDIK